MRVGHVHFFKDEGLMVAMTLVVYRAGTPNGYIQTQWETCQNEIGEQCLLDYLEPGNPAPTLFPNTCRAGSVPSYIVRLSASVYHTLLIFLIQKIDVRTAGDVATAFNFSRRTKVPITIKNTGVRSKIWSPSLNGCQSF